MLGWMILFALMTLPGLATALTGAHAASLETSSLVFAMLLFFALLTFAIRDRVR